MQGILCTTKWVYVKFILEFMYIHIPYRSIHIYYVLQVVKLKKTVKDQEKDNKDMRKLTFKCEEENLQMKDYKVNWTLEHEDKWTTVLHVMVRF